MERNARIIASPAMIFAALFLVAGSAAASPLFDDDSILEATIAGPIEATVTGKEERKERPFTLSVEGVEHEVAIRVRGKSRIRVCRFAPLRLNFRKDSTDGTTFAGQDKLKLATHCRDSDRSEQDLLEEFAAYRILNRITDVSYRVRLLRIRYADSDGQTLVERHGFVIESDDELTARLGATKAKLEGVKLSTLQAEHAATVYIFQYLIGNTDWSLATAFDEEFCCHNVNLFERGSRLYFAPYDFDLAGLVDASYAKADPSLRINSVRKRRYRGYCTSPESLRTGLTTIVERRDDILDVIRSLPKLTERDIEAKIAYLERFFAEAKDADELLERFQRRCL